jgi:hypothetical protein
MATFCELDENNIVIRSIKVGNDEVPNGNGDVAGEEYCNRLFGGTWKQTSFNTIGGVHHTIDESTGIQSVNPDQTQAFRKNYGVPEFKYDATRDAFIAPKPFDSWTLNETTCLWEAPVAMPSTNNVDSEIRAYPSEWNEADQRWEAPKSIDSGPETSDYSIKYYWNPTNSSWNLIS